MSRFLRLKNTIIHVPSVSNVSMGTSCLGKPYLSVSYHTGKKQDTLCYKTWVECESAFNTVKNAVKEIDALLANVPLTSPSEVTVKEVVVESAKPSVPQASEEGIQKEESQKDSVV